MSVKNHTSEKLEDITKVIENPKNPNKHSDAQINMLAKIIEFQGWRIPIVVSNRSGFIVRGHGRLMSAQKLGLNQVPVSYQDYESEAQEWADLVADNRIAELAEMDRSELKDIIEQLDTGEIDLDLTGFDQDSIEELMSEFFEPEEGLTGDDEIPEEVESRCKLGDLWQLGEHRLMCGDSTSEKMVNKLVKDSSPDLMITDPPYGVNYDADWRNKAKRADGTSIGASAIGKVQNDDQADWSASYNNFNGSVCYVWHASTHSPLVGNNLIDCGFELKNLIIWAKSNFAIGRGNYHHKHEPCWYSVRKGKNSKWKGDRSQTTLWEIKKPAKSDTGHSTQKPIECMSFAIQNHKGDVYDPFLGSGTTLIACEKLKRKCYGMELDPQYCDVIIQRWEDFTGKKAEKIN